MELGNLCFGNGYGPIELNRQNLQSTFCDMFEDAGINEYGYPETFKPTITDLTKQGWPKNAWQVDEFIIMPQQWDENVPGADRPNFTDLKTNTQIWWYKYVLRDPSANKNITLTDVVEMLTRLKNATRKLGSTRYC